MINFTKNEINNQGNIRAVVDADGTAIQTTDYYPYGLPMATTTGTAANRYKYGAKEFETRNGLNFHDFEARMLFNDRTLFSRPDDLAGKSPHLNPYLYCAANPLRYIDPTGEDIWKINTLGEVVAHEVTDEFDRFDFVDDDGNTIVNDDGEEQSITMEYGTVTYKKENYNNIYSENHGNMTGSFDVFKINGDKSATAIFEMFAQNVTAKTGNEIGLIRTGIIGTGSNYITSAQKKGSEPGGPALFHSQLKNGYYIREITHSHQIYPEPSRSDITSNKQILNKYPHKNTIRFKIYTSSTDSYYFYNPLDY